jgi:hypothetical protein
MDRRPHREALGAQATGYSYDQQTGTYLYYNTEAQMYALPQFTCRGACIIRSAAGILPFCTVVNGAAAHVYHLREVCRYVYQDQETQAWLEYKREEFLRASSNISSASDIAAQICAAAVGPSQ